MRRGPQLTPLEAESLTIGTEVIYRDMCLPGYRLAKVKGYQHIGAAKMLIVELEDGSKRSPSAALLYWLIRYEAACRMSGADSTAAPRTRRGWAHPALPGRCPASGRCECG
jgi:hypothetical protein